MPTGSPEAYIAEHVQEACPLCSGLAECTLQTSGWQPILDEEATALYGYPRYRWRKCDRLKANESKELAEHWLGAKFSERAFETFEVRPENAEAYWACKHYADNLDMFTKSGLMLAGPVGVGKTHLAAAILKVAFARGIPAAMVPVPKLLNEMRQGIQTGEARPLTEKVTNKRFLVLDDLGAERVTEWTQEELYLLINARYEAELPTVVTTNCTPDKLIEQVGERTADRLREMCRLVVIGGTSWRRHKKD